MVTIACISGVGCHAKFGHLIITTVWNQEAASEAALPALKYSNDLILAEMNAIIVWAFIYKLLKELMISLFEYSANKAEA